ncbi:MAG: hypothetical protein MRECE_32c004 [Mycoplasmataceae bacterium CE_OT135]|nr:MAG: hypothetical protein MRECE_32c004 [Mycoplasmataceae bacterium CE_OT135]
MAKKKFSDLEKSLLAEKDKFSQAEDYFQQTEAVKSKTLTQSKKVVREGISLPEAEAELIQQIKNQISGNNFYPSKSEILRAGLLSLSKLEKKEIKELISSLVVVKRGRK